MRIYTPCKPQENQLKDIYSIGQIISIKTKPKTYIGRIISFPSYGYNETNHRMKIESANGDWLGNIQISLESNDYGQYHISEMEIAVLKDMNFHER
jgi:hypothetical protein